MAKKLVVKRGYTLEVVSYENDGDYKATITYTFDTKEKAEAILKMCKELFVAHHETPVGMANWTFDYHYEEAKGRVIDYMKNNDYMFELFGEDKDEVCHYDFAISWNSYIMGDSEYYISRYFDKGVIYYSPEDIYLEVVSNDN